MRKVFQKWYTALYLKCDLSFVSYHGLFARQICLLLFSYIILVIETIFNFKYSTFIAQTHLSINFLRCFNFKVSSINRSTFARAFKEWKYCSYELDSMQMKNWMVCPPCHITQHSVHVDGNSKLKRFQRAGRQAIV